MPGKAAAAPRRKRRVRPAGFRRADADTVRAALDRLLSFGVGRYSSQAEFLRAFRPALRAEDPGARIGRRRLRSLLVGTPGVRLTVRYAERSRGDAPAECPVCSSPLVGIPNRTLSGGVVALGLRCRTCGYWTHRQRRVPVRYSVQRTGRAPKSGADPGRR